MSVSSDGDHREAGAQGQEVTGRRVRSGAPGALLVVGIGASAGGLAAFEAFFSGMPTDTQTDMAFVLVQHLAPDHKSILSELIKRYTRMDVFEVSDGMTVEPNCAYIIPPSRDMALLNGALHLTPSAPRGQRLTIDFFFRSLARDQRERGICIVLAGTGSDGTLGLRAVKGEGGLVMAQDPESTEYDGMPRSAIATGLVDYVLPPAEMPAQLLAYARHASHRPERDSAAPTARAEDELQKVFVLLVARTGHDFSLYKRSTMLRRVERRMAVQHVAELEGYVRYLQDTPGEVEALFQDLLIGVTHFFRDESAFERLQTQVIPRVCSEKPAGAPVRVWVPGCSTGEEAYSIAMLLHEEVVARKLPLEVQVFATDIDTKAIAIARAGTYPANIASDVSPERLARHFSLQDDGHYRVHKRIRDLIVFSNQDVVRDPPFSRLDLISCRNLMIYMTAQLQTKLVALFHYALRPGGALFLGSSETVGERAELFSTLDRKAKLYVRREDASGWVHPPLGSMRRRVEASYGQLPVPGPVEARKLPLRELAERALLEDAPVAAVANERGELLYLHGHTGQYLQLAPGEMGASLLKMARQGLKSALASALHQAVSENRRVLRSRLRVKTNGDFTLVDLTARPLPPSGDARLFLVTFTQASCEDVGSQVRPPEEAGTHGAEHPQIAALLDELHAKDEHLRATEEEMQTANEELQSTNEELQSTNEELQSTNEELETSKEELQSLNEELTTVNSELQSKLSDLSHVNNDMQNLLKATGIGTIFIDNLLCIRRFTPATTQFINVIPSDVGRPLSHLVSNLVGYDRLVADVQNVLDTLIPEKIEVQTTTGASYLMRIQPYRTCENAIEGAVITFTEVRSLTDTRAAFRESDALRRLAGAVLDLRDAITVQDLDGRILAWNPGAVRMYGYSEAEALSMNIRALVPESEREGAVAALQKLSRAEVLEPYRTQRLAKDGTLIDVTLTAAALNGETGATYGISTIERGGPP